MDKKSKVLLLVFISIVIVSVAVTYERYIISEKIEYYTDEEAFAEALLEE